MRLTVRLIVRCAARAGAARVVVRVVVVEHVLHQGREAVVVVVRIGLHTMVGAGERTALFFRGR